MLLGKLDIHRPKNEARPVSIQPQKQLKMEQRQKEDPKVLGQNRGQLWNTGMDKDVARPDPKAEEARAKLDTWKELYHTEDLCPVRATCREETTWGRRRAD